MTRVSRYRLGRHVPAGMLVLLALSACGRPEPLLSTTFDSPEALASAVASGLARDDKASLEALALSESDFRAHVWPVLPASRPERGLPFDYVWNDLRAKSNAHLAARLAGPSIGPITVDRVVFDGETTDYGGLVVMRKARVLVRDDRGQLRSLRLFGSVIRQDGRYKLFSYVTD